MNKILITMGLLAFMVVFANQKASGQTHQNIGDVSVSEVHPDLVQNDAAKANSAKVSTKVPEMSPLNPVSKVSQMVPRDKEALLRMIEARSQKSKAAPQTAAPQVMPGTMTAPAIQLESHQNDK